MSGKYPDLLRRRAESMMRLAERLLSEGGYDLAVLNRRLKCPVCGLEEDRNLIAALNLGMRGAQATQMAPDADENPRAMKGKLKMGRSLDSHF